MTISDFALCPLFTFRQTPAAGLSAFSLCVIPKDTIVLTLPGPYASIVMRKWRKEVCAWCFKWRYASPSNLTWEASKGDSPRPVKNDQHGRKNDRNSHFVPGLWCCGPSCLASWTRDFELWEGEEGQWVAKILEGFEKALGGSIRREREKRFKNSSGKDRVCIINGTLSQVDVGKEFSPDQRTDLLEILWKDMADVNIPAAEITPEFLDHCWSEVENLLKFGSGRKGWARVKEEGKPREVPHSSTKSTISPTSVSNPDSQPNFSLPVLDPDQHMPSTIRSQKPAPRPSDRQPITMPILNELELDTARFVLDGMIRKVVEQFRIFSESQASCSEMDSKTQELELDSEVPLRRMPQLTRNIMSEPGLWNDFMLLQDNELEYVRSKPYMLAAGVKIYSFLKGMVRDLSKQRWREFEQSGRQEERKRKSALEMLLSDLESFEVVRAILGRDPGNVFGISEDGEEEESEMYGWGAYVFGSFFNHDCAPNLKKRRVGRSVEFYTLRDVTEGDELSIAYVDVEGDGAERETRNSRLREHWFFSCQCARCREVTRDG